MADTLDAAPPSPQTNGTARPPKPQALPVNPGALRAELESILERFDQADQRLRQAATLPDREAAEAARREAMGDHHALTFALGDLFVLQLRYALHHQPDAVRHHLRKLLDREEVPHG